MKASERAAEFAKTWEGFKGQPSLMHPGKTLDPLADWQLALAVRFAEAYAQSELAGILEKLRDPAAVWSNILTGQIAKPVAITYLEEQLAAAQAENERLGTALTELYQSNAQCPHGWFYRACEECTQRLGLAALRFVEKGKEGAS